MAFRESVQFPHLQEMLSSYWYAGGGANVLPEIIGRVRTDSPDEMPALRADIARFLDSSPGPLDEEFEAEFLSYYWPAGDGLTARAWLEKVDQLLISPHNPDLDVNSGWP